MPTADPATTRELTGAPPLSRVRRRTWAPVGGRSKVWVVGTALVCLLVSLPVASVALLAFGENREIWHHLASTVLGAYVSNTLLLMLGVGAGTLVIGVGTAWLTVMCRFPGRGVLEWALLLPIAMPAYILAFVYTDLLDYAGPVQSALREAFGFVNARDYWFPAIRTLPGAIAMMTITLYPYVYLLTRAAFLEQSVCVLEASRTLGCTPAASFWRVALPLARPAVVIGLALVLMETLNDYGTVDYFAVPTFSVGVYDVWMNMNAVAGAAQLALAMLALVIVLVAAERWARGQRQYRHTTNRYRALPSYRLSGVAAMGALLACLLPVSAGFLLPVTLLAGDAWAHHDVSLQGDFTRHLGHSLALSAGVAAIALVIGLFLAYGARLSGSRAVRLFTRTAILGYAVPGAVLAVGILVPFGAFDNALDAWARHHLGTSTGLLLSGTVAAVMFGCVVRFLALTYGAAESGLDRVSPSMDGAARTLGATPLRVLTRIHWPIVRASMLAGALLVFVDTMKELPMTIVLRPFDFDTLATFVFQYASDERFEEAALAALAIVAVGILPVVVLSRAMRASRPGGVSHG